MSTFQPPFYVQAPHDANSREIVTPMSRRNISSLVVPCRMSHNSCLQTDHQASSVFVIEHRNNKTSLAIASERYPDSHTGYTAVLARFQFVSRTHTPHQTQKSTENFRSQRIIGGKATLTSICSAIAFGHKVQHLFNHLLSDLSSNPRRVQSMP